jgi:hypothetical protein
MDPVTQTCGCGGVVPREDGPTHPYLAAAPGCWRLYGELTLRLAGPGTAQPSHVDCYAAQHPGGAEVDRRQRASVAVHLVALCARLERGVPAERLNRVRSRVTATVLAARGLPDWPLLAAPEAFGPVTAAGLHGFSHESSLGVVGLVRAPRVGAGLDAGGPGR